MITEIIVLGRGGQGGVTGAKIIAEAAYLSGNYFDVSSTPTFGTERRGSAVYAYTRIADKEKIWTRQSITNPDMIVVLDQTILNKDLIDKIKPSGVVILNTDKCAIDIIRQYEISDDKTVLVSNVTHLCIENGFVIDGQPMVNTPILGALTRVIDSISIEDVSKAIIERFGEQKAEINIKIAKLCAETADIRNGGQK